jgi:hypothetical protein
VDAARSDPPTPRARAAARAGQRREQERAACAKERRIRRRECREQQGEEYRLREHQALSPRRCRRTHRRRHRRRATRGGGGSPPERWNPPPPWPQAAEAAVEQAPATRPSVEEPASATAASAGTTAALPEPSRKRKRGFSNLRSAALPPCALDFEGLVLILVFSRSQGDVDRPALAPAKALRSEALVPTRWRSSRAPRAAGSATTTCEPSRGTVVAT